MMTRRGTAATTVGRVDSLAAEASACGASALAAAATAVTGSALATTGGGAADATGASCTTGFTKTGADVGDVAARPSVAEGADAA